MPYKTPVSVLVVIYTPDLQVLLLERADHPGYWQSVTGSCDPGESLRQTAVREVAEETGLDADAVQVQRLESGKRLRDLRRVAPSLRARRDP